MFDIKPKDDVDFEIFNKFYFKNRCALEDLLNYIESKNDLDEAVKRYSYDEINNVLIFLKMCKSNYVISCLELSLITYLHAKEDELFLDLCLAIQEEEIEEWLDDRTLLELKILKNCIQSDKSFFEDDVYDLVLKHEKLLR